MAELKQYTERIWVDFLCKGTAHDYASIYNEIDKALRSFSSSLNELTGEIVILSSRGRSMRICDEEYYHGNITLGFVYHSEHRLEELFRENILPQLFDICLNPILNSNNCIIFENLYPDEYFIAMTKRAAEDADKIFKKLKEMGHGISIKSM